MWVKIPNTTYEAHPSGLIRRIGKTDPLSPFVSKRGYQLVTVEGVRSYVHRIIAAVFVPNPDGKPQVNHKDGNKQNNNAENLEWVTCKENIQHAYATGTAKVGEARHLTKLKSKEVEYIRLLLGIGYTHRCISSVFRVSESCISSIAQGRTWKHL